MHHHPDAADLFAGRLSRRLRQYVWHDNALAPTVRSAHRIGRELHLQIPTLLIQVAQRCPEYGEWFGGLGEDYSGPSHILTNNHALHRDGLPARYVIFNQGYDGDCDCWDLGESPVDGEYPIKYVSLLDRSDGRRDWVQVDRVLPYATNMYEYFDEHHR